MTRRNDFTGIKNAQSQSEPIVIGDDVLGSLEAEPDEAVKKAKIAHILRIVYGLDYTTVQGLIGGFPASDLIEDLRDLGSQDPERRRQAAKDLFLSTGTSAGASGVDSYSCPG